MTSNGTPPRKRTCHVGLLAAFLFAAGFALANVPGHPVVGPNVLAEGKYGPHFECGYEEMVHGWPLVFLKQDGLYSRADGAPLAWGVGRVSQFRLGSLAVNLTLLLLGALVIGWLVDRHIRENGWRFTMIHLLSAVLCVAAVCAFASRRMKTHDGQVAELLRAGFKNIGVAEWQPFGVYWLRRLTGPRYWEWGDTLVGADLEHSDQIATLPGKATIKVLRIRTVKCDAMPSLETYAGLVA